MSLPSNINEGTDALIRVRSMALTMISGQKLVNVKRKSLEGTSKSFACPFIGCKSAYSRQWKLDRHYFTHTGERPYQCKREGCTKSYQCNTHLQRHIKSAHKELTVFLACTIPNCKAKFSSQAALLKHFKNHGKPREFICDQCKTSFQKRNRFEEHLLFHKGLSENVCSVCNTHWTCKSLLRRHMKSHKERPCSYQDCDFSSSSQTLMRKHQKLVHREVYQCETCKKSFNNKGILRYHVKIHIAGEHRSVFSCPKEQCKRTYFEMKNLRHHIRVFHAVERYYCIAKDCSRSYTSKDMLAKHTARDHNKQSKKELISTLASIAPVISDSDSEVKLSESRKEEPVQLLIISKDHVA